VKGDIMEIILRRVECIATYGEVREEPCLMWRIDEDNDQYGSRCLAPEHGMRAGSTVEVNVQLPVERSLELRIVEHDPGHDDCLGTYNLVPGERESADPVSGSAYLDFPATDRSKQHYRLYYSWFLDEEGEAEPWYYLHLLDIHCRNAQEWKDYVFIKVDGIKVWGPVRMRDTGDASQKSIDCQVTIRRNSIISLWEEDGNGNRSDHFGSYRLDIGEDYDFDHDPEPIRFRYDRHGTAEYDLRYRVSRRM
jgi:hypothetical protein